jgi:NDP-sugar pyrophosphorylase family protein
MMAASGLRSAHPQIDMVKPIVVGSNVFLGYGAIIMPGVTIGDNVVIGAGAVVTRDIPANSVAVGVPARVIRSTGAYIADALTRGESTKAMTRREKRHSTKQNTAPSHKGHCQPPLAGPSCADEFRSVRENTASDAVAETEVRTSAGCASIRACRASWPGCSPARDRRR